MIVANYILNTWVGRIVSGLVVGLITIKAWLAIHHDPKVRREVTTEIAKQSEKTSAKARNARTAARSVDDPVKRVRDAYCRDCD